MPGATTITNKRRRPQHPSKEKKEKKKKKKTKKKVKSLSWLTTRNNVREIDRGDMDTLFANVASVTQANSTATRDRVLRLLFGVATHPPGIDTSTLRCCSTVVKDMVLAHEDLMLPPPTQVTSALWESQLRFTDCVALDPHLLLAQWLATGSRSVASALRRGWLLDSSVSLQDTFQLRIDVDSWATSKSNSGVSSAFKLKPPTASFGSVPLIMGALDEAAINTVNLPFTRATDLMAQVARVADGYKWKQVQLLGILHGDRKEESEAVSEHFRRSYTMAVNGESAKCFCLDRDTCLREWCIFSRAVCVFVLFARHQEVQTKVAAGVGLNLELACHLYTQGTFVI